MQHVQHDEDESGGIWFLGEITKEQISACEATNEEDEGEFMEVINKKSSKKHSRKSERFDERGRLCGGLRSE